MKRTPIIAALCLLTLSSCNQGGQYGGPLYGPIYAARAQTIAARERGEISKADCSEQLFRLDAEERAIGREGQRMQAAMFAQSFAPAY